MFVRGDHPKPLHIEGHCVWNEAVEVARSFGCGSKPIHLALLHFFQEFAESRDLVQHLPAELGFSLELRRPAEIHGKESD